MKIYLDSCTIQRPLYTFAVLRNKLEVDKDVEERAAVLVKRGIKAMDAVHVALAKAAGADCFCSCDDRLLRKLRRMKDVQLKLASPLELIEKLES